MNRLLNESVFVWEPLVWSFRILEAKRTPAVVFFWGGPRKKGHAPKSDPTHPTESATPYGTSKSGEKKTWASSNCAFKYPPIHIPDKGSRTTTFFLKGPLLNGCEGVPDRQTARPHARQAAAGLSLQSAGLGAKGAGAGAEGGAQVPLLAAEGFGGWGHVYFWRGGFCLSCLS